MTRKTIVKLALGLGGLALVAGLAVAWLLYAPRQTPEGQAPLVTLDRSSLDRIREAFNASPEDVRVLVLLSPT